jgi:hypothetical protein
VWCYPITSKTHRGASPYPDFQSVTVPPIVGQNGGALVYDIGRDGDPLERAVLLEVAGTDAGSVLGLLPEKLVQAARNPERLPAIAAEEPRIAVADARPEP